LRESLALPDGYQVTEAEGSLRLINPQGTLIQEIPAGPDAASAIEIRAWQDAWEQVERELRQGNRPLHELHRLRQYMRMLDATSHAPVEVEQPARRPRLVTALAFAATAAAAFFAGVILSTEPVPVAVGPEPVAPAPNIAVRPDVTIPSTKETAPDSATGKRGIDAGRRPRLRRPSFVSRPIKPARVAGGAAGLSAISGYVVGVGEFASRASAETRMHLIRAKGYLVFVAEVGDSFHVVTRTYRTRAQAEIFATALQEIGLPARAQPRTTPFL
jgi:hypothetical protein